MPKRVVIYSSKPPSHAGSYIRLWGPLSISGEIEPIGGCDFTGSEIMCDFKIAASADLIVLQRDFPIFAEASAALLRIAATRGIPVIYETDSDLMSGASNGQDHTTVGIVRDRIGHVLNSVKAVTVSTDRLADDFRQYHPTVHVIPSLIDDRIWTTLPKLRRTDKLIVGCMGTPSHREDLAAVVPALRDLLARHAGYIEVWLWGCVHSELTSLPGARLAAPMVANYPAFAGQFAAMRPDIAIAPLRPSIANASGSAMKFFEYSILRIPGVYADADPYASVIENGKTGLLVEDSPEAWYDALESLVLDSELRERMGGMARIDVLRKYALTKNSNPMAQVILDQINRSASPERSASGLKRDNEPSPIGLRAIPALFQQHYDREKLDHCQQLRRDGSYEQDAKAILELLESYPSDKDLLMESLRLMLNLGQYRNALANYEILEGLYGVDKLQIEPEAIYRLQIANPNANVGVRSLTQAGDDALWVHEHLSGSGDQAHEVEICDSTVTTPSIINYAFQYCCHSCGQKSGFHLQATLLIDREVFCPFCFARHRVTFDAIRKFARERRRNLLCPDINDANHILNNARRKINEFNRNDEAPLLVQYLNQDFIFWIVSKLANSLKLDEGKR